MKCPFSFFHLTIFVAGFLSCISFLQYSKDFSLSKVVFSVPVFKRPDNHQYLQQENVSDMVHQPPINQTAKGPPIYTIYASLSSTADPYYLGSLPLAAMAWIRLGVKPLVCLVGDPKEYETNMTKPSIDLLKNLGANLTYLHGNTTLKKATIAQHCRMHAANSNLKLKPEDVIILSDSDYIPIHRERHWAEAVDLFLYNSQCCGYEHHKGLQFPHLTVLTMGMTVAAFREVLEFSKARYEDATSIEVDLVENFGKDSFLGAYTGAKELGQLHGNRMWYADQILISFRVHEWKRRKLGVIRTGEWSLVGARLDRVSWPGKGAIAQLDVQSYSDMHLMRPTMTRWIEIREVFQKLFSSDHFKMVDDYGMELLKYQDRNLNPDPKSFQK